MLLFEATCNPGVLALPLSWEKLFTVDRVREEGLRGRPERKA
jgi:hypothetical protein